MSDSPITAAPFASSSGLATLNAARLLCRESENFVARDCGRTYAAGRVSEACAQAEAAIFRVLNVASSYAGVPISETVMYGRDEAT